MPSDVGIALAKVKETILANYCVDSVESGGGAWGHSVNPNKLQPSFPFKIIPGPGAATATVPYATQGVLKSALVLFSKLIIMFW